jgi:hypothetical protein
MEEAAKGMKQFVRYLKQSSQSIERERFLDWRPGMVPEDTERFEAADDELISELGSSRALPRPRPCFSGLCAGFTFACQG